MLRQSEKVKLDQAGYLLLKNYFSQDFISTITDSIMSVIEGVVASVGLEEEFDFGAYSEVDEVLVKLISMRPELQSTIYNRLQQMPLLLAVPGHVSITKLASEILSSSRIGVWPRVQLRMDLPADSENVINWHNDYIYNKGTSCSYTFWFPLVSLNDETGYLDFARGSHLSSDVSYEFMGSDHKFKIKIPQKTLSEFDIVTPKPSVGDLVVFHSQTWHTGKLNKSKNKARLSGLFRMQNLNTLEL
jgi:hypothetical protein